MSKTLTKDQRIAAMRAALHKLAQQTHGYDRFSMMGGLHKIAQEAYIADVTTARPPRKTPDAPAPLTYGQVGHVCGSTGRVAITLRDYAELDEVWGYLYSTEAEGLGLDPWRVVEYADRLCQHGELLDAYDVWMDSGVCLSKRSGNTAVYVRAKYARGNES